MSSIRLPRQLQKASTLQQLLKKKPERYWSKRGERMALELFHDMAKRVPAYKEFLAEEHFNPRKVRDIEDFRTIPLINKDNYLRKYPREALCWDGKFANKRWVISTTSGSTGEPFYFPRTDLQDEYYALTAELYLRENFDIQHRKTLYVDAFPMGAWIGGVFTYEAIKRVARKGYDLSVITPGIHKQEVVNAVKQLGGSFDQVIIGAYAPFLKDIIDDGKREGIVWSNYKLGFVFSAEAFTEKFRDYVLSATGAGDALKATLNHYGTVDLGTMAHETPESIMIRRKLVEDKKMKLIFPEADRQPTFAQFNPKLFYFEAINNNLICSASSGLPLVRYDLKDYGGVISRNEVHGVLREHGYNVEKDAQIAGIDDTLWNLPFVFVYERNDFSVSYYAFLIYPDTIRRSLQHDVLTHKVTGKFSMSVDYNDAGREQLNVNVELKHGVVSSEKLTKEVLENIQEGLIRESSEYRETYKTVGPVVMPTIYLWDYEDPTYFRPGTKQKWTIK